MNSFVFLCNVHNTEKSLLSALKIWSYCLNADCVKYFSRSSVPLSIGREYNQTEVSEYAFGDV
jgi:hypothetical protein